MASQKHNTTYLDALHDQNIDPTTNTIYLMGEERHAIGAGESINEPGVEYVMANTFIRNFNFLASRSPAPITIHMKTCGGDWTEGMAIHNTIKHCPNKVIILSYTHARSMSSLIFLAADLRVMMPDSTFMFHMGSNGMYGTNTQFQTEAAQDRKVRARMLDIYVDAMSESEKFKNWTRAKMRNWLVRRMQQTEEVYLTPQEAIECGFSDLIVGQDGVTPYNLQEFIR